MTTVNSLAGFQDIFYHVTLHLAAHLEVSDASYHESSDSKAVRRTLARLARVHSGLTRPAIVALWRRLWDDRPLRHLLWVVGIARKTSSRCQWEIAPLEIRSRRAFWPKSSWGRFQEYASLVREIVLDPFVGSGTMDAPLQSKIWQDEFWCRLSSVLGNTLILPNLDVASLLTPDSFRQRPFDTGVLSLLNPSIRELNVILRRADTYDESKVRSALADCFSSFRDLEVLSVEISVPALNLGPLAQSLPRLRYLRLDTGFQVNSDHLALLSAFRGLHYLSIDLSPRICLDHPVAFARLRTLRVLSNGFAALGVLIAHMDAPQLRTLSVSESHRDSGIMHGELQNILRTLVVKCPFLTDLEWESEQVVRPYWFGTTLAKLFSPLLSHPTIRSFSANFIGLIVCYTPADFRAVAKAWPDLQTFRLYDHMDFSHTVDQYADVESLLELAHHCPHLRDLHIPELKFDVDCLGAAMETTPHGLGGLGVARFHVCSGEQDLDHHREREGLTQFRRWAERIFPFAMIHTPSLMLLLRRVQIRKGLSSNVVWKAVSIIRGSTWFRNWPRASTTLPPRLRFLSILSSLRQVLPRPSFAHTFAYKLRLSRTSCLSIMASTPSLTGIHDIDIFYQVLSHLLPDPKAPTIGSVESSESRSARKALACLARTHSSFTQPALAEMWRSLPSQKPLEHLLRVVGIAQRPPPAAGQWYTPPLQMCGTPITHKSGWIRFQEYASLVREIIIDPVNYSRWDVDSKLLDDTFWCRLFAAFGDMPVLPCLEGATLRSTNSLRSIDTGMLRLVNPFIREFIVTFPHASKIDLKPLWTAITVCFSSVQNLEVFSMEVQDVTPFLDMETLPRLHPRLRSLKLHRSAPIKLSCLRPLTTLLNLEYVSIKLLPWDSELPSLPTMVFPRLRSLQVSCGGFAIAGMLLNHIEVPQLQSFSLKETHENSNDMAQEFSSHLRTLVTKCPFLTAFEWHSNQARIRRVGYLGKRLSSAPLSEILTPLLSHRAMRQFSATFWGPVVPYTPTDFLTIAEAWPDLESFVLSDDMGGDRTWAERYADLESVVALARHCPGLRSLHFPTVQFDSSSALVSELVHGTPAPHWLRELYVDHVTRPDPEERDGARSPEYKAQFRALMEKLFPNATIPRLG